MNLWAGSHVHTHAGRSTEKIVDFVCPGGTFARSSVHFPSSNAWAWLQSSSRCQFHFASRKPSIFTLRRASRANVAKPSQRTRSRSALAIEGARHVRPSGSVTRVTRSDRQGPCARGARKRPGTDTHTRREPCAIGPFRDRDSPPGDT